MSIRLFSPRCFRSEKITGVKIIENWELRMLFYGDGGMEVKDEW